MSFRPRLTARRAAACLILLPALVALAGCGAGRDQFAPACPIARPLHAATQVQHYRPGAPGGRRDLTDLEYSGRVLAVAGKCRKGGKKDTLHATLRVQLQLQRGPAAPAAGVVVPYFIAVAKGTHVLARRVFATRVAFRSGSDQVLMTSAPVGIDLPLPPGASGADYTIWVGFQLTRGEYAAARGR